jgi:hypothetical protein
MKGEANMSVTVANARVRLLKYFYWNYKASIERPLLAAASVGLVAMGLIFLLGAAVSIPLALLGAAWGVESIALLVLVMGSLTTAIAAAVFLRHNFRVARRRHRYPVSLAQRAWEMVCDIATALFAGLCTAAVSLVLAYFVGVLVFLFWPGPIDWQRQLIVYPPIVVGIPTFVVGAVGFLVYERRRERNLRKQLLTRSSPRR